MYPIGETKLFQQIITSAGGGIDTTGEILRPGTGYEWILNYAHIYHLEAGQSRVGGWNIADAKKDLQFAITAVSLATSAVLPLSGQGYVAANHGEIDLALPMRFNHSTYPIASFVALTAGQVFVVEAMVLERPANLELEVLEWIGKIAKTELPPGLRALKDRIEYYPGGI